MRRFTKPTSPPHSLITGATLAVSLAFGALSYVGATGEALSSSAPAQQAPQETQQPDQQAQQKIVITMAHGTDDLHASVMALKLAKALLDEGADVTLFVNLEAVRLVDNRQPDDLRWGPKDMTVGDLFRSVVDAGGKVLVCPHCAEVVGLTKSQLRNGATIATMEQVAEAMLEADKIIDY